MSGNANFLGVEVKTEVSLVVKRVTMKYAPGGARSKFV